MQAKSARSFNVRRLVILAMFTAMAYVVMLVLHIRVQFLTMDIKDAVITLCGLYFGPLSALVISVAVSLIEFLTVSETGIYGFIMNVIGTVVFSVTASLIYKWKKTLSGAFIGLFSATALMTAVMLVANLFITPLFLGAPTEQIRQMIPTLLLPFNLLKGVINVGVVLLLYKTLSKALHKAGILSYREEHTAASAAPKAPLTAEEIASRRRKGIYITLLAVVLIAVSLLLIFLVMDGHFLFGKG